MRFVAYSSKGWWLFMLALLGLFVWGLSFFWAGFGSGERILFGTVFGLLLGASAVAVVMPLFSSRPVLEIDEEGIACYRLFYATIAWEDILAAQRVPRVEKRLGHGETVYNMSFRDAWRPIDIVFRDIDKYSKLLSPRTHRSLRTLQPGQSQAPYTVRIDFTGMTGSSAEAIRVIEHYLQRTNHEGVSAKVAE